MMSKRKRFKEHAGQLDLNESSWLSKGFAVGQGVRHETLRRQLESTTKRIQSLCHQGERTNDETTKLNLLFEAIGDLAAAMKLTGDISKTVINVAIATNLLETDKR